MDGPMSGVDPDQVENDVGSMWRTLYKMGKSFSEYPSPLKMAQKVYIYTTHRPYRALTLIEPLSMCTHSKTSD